MPTNTRVAREHTERIVDLHAHFPMHFYPMGDHDELEKRLRHRFDDVEEITKHALVALAGLLFKNWHHVQARADIEEMRAGGVETALSVLYPFFEELDGLDFTPWSLKFEWPRPRKAYFQELREECDAVARHVARDDLHEQVTVAQSWEALQAAHADGKLALVHAVEGGFAIGSTPDDIRRNVATLAEKGIAYVTVAHLFYRHVAANVAPLPQNCDAFCEEHLPVPTDIGLTDLGVALVDALIDNGILIDLTHMTSLALQQTLDLLDAADPGQTIPVVVSHGSYRFGNRKYGLTDGQIARIAKRRGTIGVILCRDIACDGIAERDAVAVVRRHVEAIGQAVERAGVPGVGAADCISIGTDLDGFVEPLEGIETAEDLPKLAQCVDAAGRKAFLRNNAYRVLSSGHRAGHSLRGRTPWAPLPDRIRN